MPYAHRAGTAQNLRGGTVEATAVTVGGGTGVAIDGSGITLGGATVVDASGKATVSTGAGLTGNGSTASPLAVASGGVTSAMLASDEASLSKVSGGAIAATATGWVGIGTATPTAKLTVNLGDLNVDQGNLRLYGGTKLFWGNPGQAEITGNSGAQNLILTTGSAERMRIDNFGNVGVGTAAPQNRSDWKSAGLLFPSTATGIIRTVSKSMAVRKLGRMRNPNLAAIDRELPRSLDL